MNCLLAWLRAATLTAGVICLLSVAYAALRVAKATEQIAAKASATLTSLNNVGPQTEATLAVLQRNADTVSRQLAHSLAVTDKVGTALDGIAATLDSVNRPCATAATGSKPCGTLADVNRTLATVRGTFGQIEVAARHENRNLTTLDQQEAQLYEDTHAAVANFNALLTSTDVAKFMASSAETSAQVAAIATDVHREADRITAPQPWYKKLYGYGNMGVNIACLATHSCPF